MPVSSPPPHDQRQRHEERPSSRKRRRGTRYVAGLAAGAALISGTWVLSYRRGAQKSMQRRHDWTNAPAATMGPVSRSSGSARIAYLIMASGQAEVTAVKSLLTVLHHPGNVYIIHLDTKTEPAAREDLRSFLETEGIQGKLLEPALMVSWGGSSVTLCALWGIAAALRFSSDWDYFINLSAMDMPLVTQEELGTVLGLFKPNGTSFLTSHLLVGGWKKRAQEYIDDEGLFRNSNQFSRGPSNIIGTIKNSPAKRALPTQFTLYHGEFWMILHRSMCEWMSFSVDNIARKMQFYFSPFRISDESYFQTTVCHPEATHNLPVHNDNMRSVSWSKRGAKIKLHPKPIGMRDLREVMESGALFARKFAYDRPDSVTAVRALTQSLQSGSAAGSAARMQGQRDHLAHILREQPIINTPLPEYGVSWNA